MRCIVITIQHRAQLARSDPEMLSQMQGDIETIVSAQGGEGTPEELLYRFPEALPSSLHKLVQAALAIRKALEEKEDLYGFSIWMGQLSPGQGERESLEGILRQGLTTAHTNAVWISREEKSLFAPLLVLKEEGDWVRVISRKESSVLPLIECASLFMERTSYTTTLSEKILPSKPPFSPCCVLYLQGEEGSGKEETLLRVLTHLTGRGPDSWMVVTPQIASFPLTPFVRGLSPAMLKQGETHLIGEDLREWRSLHPLIEHLPHYGNHRYCSDRWEIDFLRILTLYLKIYSRSMAEEKTPPMVILRCFEQFDTPCRDVIRRIFIPQAKEHNLLLAVLSSKNVEKEYHLGNRPSPITFLPYTTEELAQILKKCLPDLSLTTSHLETILKQTRGLPLKLFHGFVTYSSRLEEDPTIQLTKTLDLLSLEILYLVAATEGGVGRSLLFDFLSQRGKPRSEIEHRLAYLVKVRLLRSGIVPLARVSPVLPAKQLGEKKDALVEAFLLFLSEERATIGMRELSSLESLWKESAATVASLSLYSLYITLLLNGEKQHQAKNALAHPPWREDEITANAQHSLSSILEAGKIRSTLLYGTEQQVLAITFPSLGDPLEHFGGNCTLQKARYGYSQGKYTTAIKWAKEALLGFQRHGDHLHVSATYIELGLSFLAQNKFHLAMDYFKMTKRISSQIGDLYHHTRASLLEAFSHYHFGNISRALCQIKRLLPEIWKRGKRDWYLFALFLKGWILFAIGDYGEALLSFEEGEQKAEHYRYPSIGQVHSSWKGRCLTYRGDPHKGRKVLGELLATKETLYFLAESLHFEHKDKEALHTILRAVMRKTSPPETLGEREDWSCGFTVIMARVVPLQERERLLSDHVLSFKSYLRGLRGDPTKARKELRTLCQREDALHFPDLHHYYYLLSRIEEGSSEEEKKRKDMALEQAMRFLMRIVERSGDQIVKQAFLNKNYWNRKIVEGITRRAR